MSRRGLPRSQASRAGPHLAYILRRRPERKKRVAALFVDRDGVLNQRQVDGYVLHPHQLVPLGAVVPTLARASKDDIPVVIITNQGCLSRQLIDGQTLEGIHRKLVDHLSERGVAVDAIYACPHHPAAVDPADRLCTCRKPSPGLLTAASADLGLDLERSVFLGDQETDRVASAAAGIPSKHFYMVDPARMDKQDEIRLADRVIGALQGRHTRPRD